MHKFIATSLICIYIFIVVGACMSIPPINALVDRLVAIVAGVLTGGGTYTYMIYMNNLKYVHLRNRMALWNCV